MFFKPKELYKYKALEKIKVDVNETDCKLIDEDDYYKYYRYKSYKDGSGGYILRQEKLNPKKIVFFGENRKYNIAYKNHLFQVDEWGELGRLYITARNNATGVLTTFDWLSKDGISYVINGYGRFRNQDEVKDVSIQNNQLVFHVSREKANDDPYRELVGPEKYNITTNYKIIVEEKAGKFYATAIFDLDKISGEKEIENYIPAKGKTQEVAGAKGKYWVCEKGTLRCLNEKCPESCNAGCPIYYQTLALKCLLGKDYEKAILQLKKAVEIEPNSADAWNNLGAAYGQLGKHQDAFNSYQKSYSLLQKPNPMYGQAVAAKNMKDYPLALQCARIYMDKFGSDERIESLITKLSESQRAD